MLLKIAVFVVPLGFDTLAVALALGLRGMRPFRPALTFALFEAVMPLVGLVLGRVVGARFETPAVVFGGIVVLGVAVYMAREALEEKDEAETHRTKPHQERKHQHRAPHGRNTTLVALSCWLF